MWPPVWLHPINKPGDSPEPVAMSYWENRKRKGCKLERKRKAFKHKGLYLFLFDLQSSLCSICFISVITLASFNPPDLVPETCYLLMHILPSFGKKSTQM